ncbi:hypothetical protein ES288_D02G033200v1 [Gossypium darwinii]|uniref:Uncharacterized protein n=1 Tax=Gossypium darwinii TaxID=34276 RepID=A0A5D2D8G0_GOSDA|nr:hypothetical protein ES288_D02G033200v1 [Gossypium darwinii]
MEKLKVIQGNAWICGLVQTLLYADFFYYYFQRFLTLWKALHSTYVNDCNLFDYYACSCKNNMKLQLPA